MELIGKITLTVLCIILTLISLFWKKHKRGYDTTIDTLEIEKSKVSQRKRYLIAVLFILPIISIWFEEWAWKNDWNIIVVFIYIIIFILFVIPKLKNDEDRNEIKKHNENTNYNTAD